MDDPDLVANLRYKGVEAALAQACTKRTVTSDRLDTGIVPVLKILG